MYFVIKLIYQFAFALIILIVDVLVYVNLYIKYINSSVYILIYILRNNLFLYCAVTIYVPYKMFKSN